MTDTTAWVSAARVVRRLGFGATGIEVDAAVARGVHRWVADVLAAPPAADPGAIATPAPRLDAIAAPGRAVSAAMRQKVNSERSDQQTELTAWWLRRMVSVHNPAPEKLTFVWHNHFATSAQKVRDASAMLAQNEKLRSMGLGEFRPLAYAMLTDAAMLRWLDGAQNTKSAPNENLAREFMELFALGHGNGYTETDVREGARALTGWRTTTDGATALRTRAHDTGTKTVLGVTGDLDASSFCDAVLGHPASSGYVATSMWRQLASDAPPPPDTLRRLTDAYGPRRDLRALVTAIVTDPAFTTSGTSIVMSPVEWMVGLARTLTPQVTPQQITMMTSALRTLGQLPFFPPSVGGWPAGQAWLSTAGAETRFAVATRFAAHATPAVVIDAAPRDRIDALGHLLGVGRWSDRTASVLRTAVGHPPALTAIGLNSPEYLTA
ncbi:MAG: DUF1800 domain-containing protein [Corynebacteriales bacterium]|nr:DUF1800 domain-containing protein [Mycobacteriales bacterium]